MPKTYLELAWEDYCAIAFENTMAHDPFGFISVCDHDMLKKMNYAFARNHKDVLESAFTIYVWGDKGSTTHYARFKPSLMHFLYSLLKGFRQAQDALKSVHPNVDMDDLFDHAISYYHMEQMSKNFQVAFNKAFIKRTLELEEEQ